MRTRHHCIAFGFLFGLALCARAAEPGDPFASDAQTQIQELEKKYATFEAQPEYKRVKECKEAVRNLITMADSDDKRRQLADLLATSFGRSSKFQFYEYYFLWLGGRAEILNQPQSEKAKELQFSLAEKIARRNQIQISDDIRNEICSMAIENILSAIQYDHTIIQNGQIDWTAWDKFHTWLKENRGALVFDPMKRKFVVPTSN